jgi:hypothetical protein
MPANPAAIRQNLHQLETELEAQERLEAARKRRRELQERCLQELRERFGIEVGG